MTKTFLKFKDDLESNHIDVLTRYGFNLLSIHSGNWRMYSKDKKHLSVQEKKQLADECNRLCEPMYGNMGVGKEDVESSLIVLSQSKSNKLHKEFILDWMHNNIDDSLNDDIPWSC